MIGATFMQAFKFTLIASLSLICLTCEVCPAQINGIYAHAFPRTIAFNMERIGREEYYQKFDVLIMSPQDSNTAKLVHALSPHTYCLPTRNWTQGGIFWKAAYDTTTIPEVWKLKTSAGVQCQSDDGAYPIYNVTSFCGRFSGSIIIGTNPTITVTIGTAAGLGQGETFGEALARITVQQWSVSVWDGYSSDGTAKTINNEHNNSDVDLRRLGENTITVKGQAFVDSAWQGGWNAIIRDIRARFVALGVSRLLDFHSQQDTFLLRNGNGAGLENSWTHAPRTFAAWKVYEDQFDSVTSNLPRMSWLEDTFKFDSLHAPTRKHDYFRYMRFGLGCASMTDAYYTIGDPSAPGYSEHLWTSYYDEFDLNLGQATGRSVQIGSTGVWVRFFDSGCVIVNTSSSTQTVTNAQIGALTGYAGPYYRFRGNQDPNWNNGSVFSTVTLISTAASWAGATQNVGDAVFLVRTAGTTVVADVIADDAYASTSPGSIPAVFTGTWAPDFSQPYPNHTWEITMPQQGGIPKWYYDQRSSSGTGSNTATFTPTINISGDFYVYEWHPPGSGFASNVPTTISYAGGTDVKSIDQSTNTGQWNLIGTYAFKQGGTNKIVITNNANGNVWADAYKFVYRPYSTSGCQ